MRTKHLLWTMALPALFAACSSEDVFEAGQADQTVGRKLLNDITFTLDGADTRFDRGESGWSISEGDAFGACLVDVYSEDENAKRPVENYKLAKYIQTNYQYAYDKSSGAWTTPARMVEGNYLFYAPFNENHLGRTPMEVIVPVSQQLDVDANGVVDPYSAINNVIKTGNPFFVGYQFLPAENQEKSIKLSLRPIFAMPEISVKNDKAEDVTIKKVVIKTANNFDVKADLKITNSETVASASVGGVVGNFYNVGAESKTNPWGAWVNSTNTANKNLNGTTADLMANSAASTNIIVVNVPDGMTVKAGETVKFYVVMPAKKYTGTTTVYAYINDEEGFSFSITDAMTMYPNKRYPQEEYLNDGSLSSKAGKMFTNTIAKAAEPQTISETFPVVVSTTEELVAAVKNGTKAFKVIPTSDKVAINETVVEAMRQVNFQGMTIDGDIIIEGGADAKSALTLAEKVTINGTATVKGCVVLDKSANNTSVTASTVKVESGASLNVKNASISYLENKGTVDANAVVTRIENKAEGVLNLAKAPTTLKNLGTVNIAVADYACAGGTMEGIWNVNKNMSITIAATIAKDAVVTIASGVKVSGAQITVDAEGELNINGRVDNDIVLNGTVDTTNGNKDAVLNVNDGATIVGAVSGTSGSGEANIVNVDKGASFFTPATLMDLTSIYTHNGDVTKSNKLAAVSNVNKVVVNGDIISSAEMTSTGINNAELVVNGDILVASGAALTIDATTISVKNVTLNANLIQSASELAISGTLKVNAGAIYTSAKMSVGKLDSEIALTWTGVQNLTIGEIISKGSLTLGKADADINVLFKGNILLAGANAIIFPATTTKKATIKVFGNVELKGAMTLTPATATAESSITVYGNSVLTIATGSSIKGGTASKVKFDSASTNPDGTAISGAETGKVVNNGTVKGVAAVYTENSTYPWWTGTAAGTAI